MQNWNAIVVPAGLRGQVAHKIKWGPSLRELFLTWQTSLRPFYFRKVLWILRLIELFPLDVSSMDYWNVSLHISQVCVGYWYMSLVNKINNVLVVCMHDEHRAISRELARCKKKKIWLNLPTNLHDHKRQQKELKMKVLPVLICKTEVPENVDFINYIPQVVSPLSTMLCKYPWLHIHIHQPLWVSHCYIPSMNIHEHSKNVIGQLLLAE